VIHDRNIVCIASNWFDHPTSKHHVMRHLSRRNHVLWVNYHASRRPQLTRGDTRLALRRLRQVCGGARRVTPQLDVLSPLLLPWPESGVARFLNAHMLCRQIRAALARLPRRPTQLWLFAPDIPEVIGRLPVERVVYYCVDDFAAFSGYNTELVEKLEARTVAGADVVFATSTRLFERHKPRHARVHLVPHGVDFEHFASATELPREDVPDDLKAIPQPVFGFMGFVSDYADLGMLAAAARARPDWSFVLLGDIRCNVAALGGVKNIHLLGGRPYEQLPAYCRGFDVGLIPFRMNRLTQAVNPIKLREYLAAGLPVVSSPLETVRRYAPAVQVAETLDEFLAACQRALATAGNGQQRARQDLVRSEGWGACVEYLSHLVETLPRTGEVQADARPGPAIQLAEPALTR
jgi:glycosyltransferase involved in cell wall biosynthesis